MASVQDVRQTLAERIQAALAPSVPDLTVYAGWPRPQDIDKAMGRAAAAVVGITAWGEPTNEKRYPVEAHVVQRGPVTLSWTVDGIAATLTGTIVSPQNVGLLVDGAPYVRSVLATDTLASLAAALAGQVAVQRPATASGATITVPGSHSIIGRAGAVSATLTEVGRQSITLAVGVWDKTGAGRSAVADLVRAALDDLRRMSLSDGTVANIRSGVEAPVYEEEKLGIARSNLRYKVEFPAAAIGTAPDAIAALLTTGPQAGEIARGV